MSKATENKVDNKEDNKATENKPLVNTKLLTVTSMVKNKIILTNGLFLMGFEKKVLNQEQNNDDDLIKRLRNLSKLGKVKLS